MMLGFTSWTGQPPTSLHFAHQRMRKYAAAVVGAPSASDLGEELERDMASLWDAGQVFVTELEDPAHPCTSFILAYDGGLRECLEAETWPPPVSRPWRLRRARTAYLDEWGEWEEEPEPFKWNICFKISLRWACCAGAPK